MKKFAMSFTVLALLSGCESTSRAQGRVDALPGADSRSAAPGRGMGGPSAEHLGRMLFFDPNLSVNSNQACAECHGANVGWTGPDEATNRLGGVYAGSVSERFGNGKPPSAAYAMRSPVLSYDPQKGFFGGNFSDGRATGWQLGSAAADQAVVPFLNPVEQALPDAASLVRRVCDAHYGRMFRRIWGAAACSDATQGNAAIARSLAAFESSVQVSPYNSKYDAVLAGRQQLDALEQRGLDLFKGKARCFACHPTEAGTGGEPAVFSNFGYDNTGVPRNRDNPFYRMNAVSVAGVPINPAGADWVDPGLAGFLSQLASTNDWRKAPYASASVLALSTTQLSQLGAKNLGKHRVPTLRNVDRRPSRGFAKAYTHNGYFKTLRGLVHFYNTRDTLPRCAVSVPEEAALAQHCWPAPEVSDNLDRTNSGNLQLTDDEEQAVVAFLGTLSDGADSGMGPMHGPRAQRPK